MSETTLTWPRRSTFTDRDRTDDQGQPLRFQQGDEVTVESGSDRHEHYLNRGFEEGTADEVLDTADDGGSTTTEPTVDQDVFVSAFTAQSATDQAESIAAGDVDPYLDAIEAANEDGDDYATVQDAIDQRRDELG